MADSKGSRPDPKNTDNSGWYSWPAIIILFALNLWPIALALLFFNVFGDEKKKSAHRSKARSMDEPVERAIARAEERRKSAAAQVDKSKTEEKPKKADKKKGKKKKEPSDPGVVLRIVGICLLALGMFLTMQFAAESLQGWTTYLEDLFMGLAFLASGGIMWGRGKYLNRMTRRSRRYMLAIGDADAMSLGEIAKRGNRTPAQTGRELQKPIDDGWLGAAA